MNEVKAGQARIFLRGDGIIVVVAENTQSHTVSDAEAVLEAVDRVRGGRRMPLLLNMAGSGTLESEAQRLYNARSPALVTAIGIVTTSVIGRVIANFLIAFNRGVLPTRLFNDEASAVRWLGEYKTA